MIKTWKQEIDKLSQKINALRGDQQASESRFQQNKSNTSRKLQGYQQRVNSHFQELLAGDCKETANQLNTWPPYLTEGWESPIWSNWTPTKADLQSVLYTGKLKDLRQDGAGNSYELPAYIPFIGQNKTILILGNESDNQEVYDLMHSLALRINLMIPHQAKFTFLDPSGFGKAFPIANQLQTRESQNDPYRVLEDVMNDMRRIISTFGLSDNKTFDAIADNIMITEGLEFMFVANFPKNFERRTIERLQNIGNNGPVAGKYLFLHCNTQVGLPRDMSLNQFENAYVLDLRKKTITYGNNSLVFKPDQAISEDLQVELLQRIKDSKPPDRKIEFGSEVAIEEDSLWENDASEFIETNIGRSGSRDSLNVWFGAKKSEGNRPCAHGMLAAMTGSGKSNLYHVLIMGLALRYSPKEIALYLIDGKQGVEFQPYKHLPHAEFVSLKSQPQLSRSILSELLEEKERRNELFTDVGVNDYESYRQKMGPDTILPRILLLIDEYQELFEDDKEGLASACLLTIAQQGRSSGIHMLLGSQRFGTVGMLHQSAIFANVHLRIAMKMVISDRNALTEFGKEGKGLIATCDLPGNVVINDQSGDDGANKLGKVALITAEERENVIQQLIRKGQDSDVPDELMTTYIFHGNAQPDLIDNPQMGVLFRSERWAEEEMMETFARREVHLGGLGEAGWFSGEKPLLAWLGQEFNVRGYAKIVLRRRLRENIIMIGDRNEARYGMLNSMLISMVLSSHPSNLQFILIDKSIPKTPWSEELTFFTEQILQPLGYLAYMPKKNREIEQAIIDLEEEMNRRHAMEDEDIFDLPEILLMITEADRIDSLLQTTSKYGTQEDSELGKRLRELYSKGPKLGIHLILSFEAYLPMLSVLGNKGLDFFRHRIAMQMSDDDAFSFVRNRKASRLEVQGSGPIRAFYLDIGSNRNSVFKPYVIGNKQREDLTFFKDQLNQRIQYEHG